MKLPQQPPPAFNHLFSPFHRKMLKAKPGPVGIVDTDQQRSSAIRFATTHGLRITTRKINGSGYGVWLVKKARNRA